MIIYLNWSNSNTEPVPGYGWLDKLHGLDKTLGQEFVLFPHLTLHPPSQDFSMVLSYRSSFSSRKSLQKQASPSYATTNKSQFWQVGGEVNNKVNFKAVSVGMPH